MGALRRKEISFRREPHWLEPGELSARARAWRQLAAFGYAVPRRWQRRPEALVLAVPWVEGVDLRAYGAARASARAQLQILHSALPAVESLHRRGFLHGDLSPTNLVVGPAGAHWIDWCEVVARDRPPMLKLHYRGKPAYLAPERAQSGQLSVEAEIFALGAIAFEIVAGQTLFPHSLDGARAAARFGRNEWRQATLLLPSPLRGPIGRALHPWLWRRTPSVADFHTELNRALEASAQLPNSGLERPGAALLATA